MGRIPVFLWIGWRQFMVLANQFSSGVLSKLDGIRDVLSGHERRLDRIDDRPDTACSGTIDATGLALEARGGHLVVQHGDARGGVHRLPQLRALEDPPAALVD